DRRAHARSLAPIPDENRPVVVERGLLDSARTRRLSPPTSGPSAASGPRCGPGQVAAGVAGEKETAARCAGLRASRWNGNRVTVTITELTCTITRRRRTRQRGQRPHHPDPGPHHISSPALNARHFAATGPAQRHR